MSPDLLETYSREFKPLRERDEMEMVLSRLGAGKARHDWLELKELAFGLLTCRVGDLAFSNARTTSMTLWKEGLHEDYVTITRVSEGRRARDVHGERRRYFGG